MGIRQVLVQFERPQRRRLGLRHHVQRRDVVGAPRPIRLGKGRLGPSIARIFSDGLLEILDGLFDSLPALLAQFVASEKVSLVGFRVDFARVRQAGSLRGEQLHRQRLRHPLCDLTLDSQDIAERAFVTFGPQMRLVAYLDELCRDPDALVSETYTSLQEVTHVQLAADLIHGLVRVLVCHCGRARDHAQA